MEKQFGGDWLVSATYVGSKGTRVPFDAQFNTALTPGPGNPQLRARLPQLAPIYLIPNQTNSSYNSLQIKAQKTFSQGLSLLASYTWSKSIDIISASEGSQQPGEGIQNTLNLRGDRAVSDFDIPQNFVFNYVYNLPIGQGKRFRGGPGWVSSKLLSGWQITGILSLRSGFPFNIYIPFDNANVGAGQQRPSLAGAIFPAGFHQTLGEWFNTKAFTVIPFTFGNLGRNVVRQDRVKNLDFGLFKNTRISEKLNLEFRSEFFNLTNHPNFGPPDPNMSDLTFGKVLSAANPRFVQFGLKLVC